MFQSERVVVRTTEMSIYTYVNVYIYIHAIQVHVGSFIVLVREKSNGMPVNTRMVSIVVLNTYKCKN